MSLYSCLIYAACNQHAPYYIVVCVLSGCVIFIKIISKKKKGRIFERNYWIQNVCYDFLYKICLKMFSFSKQFSKILSWMYRGLHKTWIFSEYFREAPKYQISWKSFLCESRCSTRTDGQTDMKQLTVVLRNFAYVSKEKLRKIPHWFAILRFISSQFTFVA